MISGVSAYSSAYAPYYAASAARGTQQTRQPFSVPASALRNEAAQSTRPAQPEQPVGDPVADAIGFSRDYPQLLLNQAYAPPPTQPAQEVLGRVQGASAGMQSSTGGDRATPGLGQEMENQAQGATGIPGDPGLLAAEGEEEPGASEGSGEAEDADGAEGGEGGEKKANGEELSREEQVQLTELKNRDREVRAHEQAHQAVGGPYAGGASYEFQQGPDGQRYAVGGEVSIDVSPEREPEATIAKMQQVKAAAMAPAEPSGQDRAVAAAATATEVQARGELSESTAAQAAGESGEAGDGQGGEGGEATGSENGGEGVEASSNPFVEKYQRQQRQGAVNPYAGAASNFGAGVFNLPDASRAIDIVA